jgi:hypothetical protein
MSFRASDERQVIQYFHYVLDTGFRRYDGLDDNITNYDTVSKAGIQGYQSAYKPSGLPLLLV